MKTLKLFVMLFLIFSLNLRSQTNASAILSGMDYTLQSGSYVGNPSKIFLDGDATKGGSLLLQSGIGPSIGNITLDAMSIGNILFNTNGLNRLAINGDGTLSISGATTINSSLTINGSISTTSLITTGAVYSTSSINNSGDFIIKGKTSIGATSGVINVGGVTCSDPDHCLGGNISVVAGNGTLGGGNVNITAGNGSRYGNIYLSVNSQQNNIGKIILSGTTSISGPLDISGNVNIGCAIAANLNVNGKIQATEIEIKSAPCSDFVFETNYSLKGLPEVEQYIKANKHLPEMPSAKEFSEKGYSLVQMDDLLLRKVEELTLYVIELKKENDLLKKMVSLNK